MKAIMVDIEALSLESHALILSIGAVEFEPTLGLGQEFYVAVKQEKQVSKWGRWVSQSTLEWWSKQSEEARKVLTDPNAVYLDEAMQQFARFINGRDIEIWGNGAHYDNVVLDNAFKAVGMQTPWGHRNNRCYRTLKAIVPWDLSLVVPSPGTEHNALDDARYQAELAIQYLRRIPK